MSAIRLLAFDIDGTLSVPGVPVSERVLGALRACVRAGIAVIPATGKKFSSIRQLCGVLGLSGPAVTCNGAMTMHAATGATLEARFLSPAAYEQVLPVLEADNRFSLVVFTDRDIACTQRHYAWEVLESIGEPISRFVPALGDLRRENVTKVLGATPSEADLAAACGQYGRQFAGVCSVMATSRQFIEMVAPGVSKGAAVTAVAAAMGIDRHEIACIGDSDNDLSLFAASGLGIAVANATAAVLEAADEVVPSSADEGAAVAVEKFILPR